MERDRLLIAIEYMLGGGRIEMPTGHTLTMNDRTLVIVGTTHPAGEPEKAEEVFLAPWALGEINTLTSELDKLPEEEFLAMQFGMALRDIRKRKYGR